MDPLAIAILLFLAGVLLGIAEIFIPSAGILVVMSLASFVGAIVFAFDVSAAWGIIFVLATPVVMVVVVVKGFKIFPKTPFGRLMILSRPDRESEARAVDSAGCDSASAAAGEDGQLVGSEGTARTELRPSGSAEIAGRRYNVVTEGDFLGEGAKVRVVTVRGNHIVVEEVS
ncbi:MAG: hypothetical protein IID40_06165 [Planctomycetes bacterium]|nr:hypothetical protein [Planctomycetota bacterium]